MNTDIVLILLIVALVILNIVGICKGFVKTFKIAYYETKLKNRGVDISEVENITMLEIFKL